MPTLSARPTPSTISRTSNALMKEDTRRLPGTGPSYSLTFFGSCTANNTAGPGIVILVSLLIVVITGQIVRMGYPDIGVAVQLLLLAAFKLVYVPLRANALYYDWVKRRIQLVQGALPGDVTQQKSTLLKIGGTSYTAPLMIVALLVILASLLPPPA
ncbi:MAG: hypothetical protein Ct9H300mP8_03540 [Gammaproteobacteria bacterium]|nr:MAG: hypothetical protein Ct9H300mP8_03540 [Gammaproteobacteria bacterium]